VIEQLSPIPETLVGFIEQGGWVLVPIFFVTLMMWTLIFEKILYLSRVYPKQAKRLQLSWNQRLDKESWYARQIRNELISQLTQDLSQSVPMIKSLIALCPLLGLLGTVTGMIEVFDVLAIAGSGNARAMAEGVSRATIPTMAGMVAALSGLYWAARLTRRVEKESRKFSDQLELSNA
jgi:biopolymer transport protein ExbB